MKVGTQVLAAIIILKLKKERKVYFYLTSFLEF